MWSQSLAGISVSVQSHSLKCRQGGVLYMPMPKSKSQSWCLIRLYENHRFTIALIWSHHCGWFCITAVIIAELCTMSLWLCVIFHNAFSFQAWVVHVPVSLNQFCLLPVLVEVKLSFVEPGYRWAHNPSPSKAPGISYQGTMKTSVRML